MGVTDDIRALILERASAGSVRKTAQAHGMKSLWEDGLRLLLEGRTTIEEVLRVTKAEALNGNGFPGVNGKELASEVATSDDGARR